MIKNIITLLFLPITFCFAQVGINTTIPKAMLDVEGTTRITNLPIGNPATNKQLGYDSNFILNEIPAEQKNEVLKFSVNIPEAHSYALLKNSDSSQPFPATFIGNAGTFKYAVYDSATNLFTEKNYYVKYEVTEFIVGNLNLENRGILLYGTNSYPNAVAYPQNELTNKNKSTVMSVKFKLYEDIGFTVSTKFPFNPQYRFLSTKLNNSSVIDDANLSTLLQSSLKSINENTGEFEVNITRVDHMILGWKYSGLVDVMLFKNP